MANEFLGAQAQNPFMPSGGLQLDGLNKVFGMMAQNKMQLAAEQRQIEQAKALKAQDVADRKQFGIDFAAAKESGDLDSLAMLAAQRPQVFNAIQGIYGIKEQKDIARVTEQGIWLHNALEQDPNNAQEYFNQANQWFIDNGLDPTPIQGAMEEWANDPVQALKEIEQTIAMQSGGSKRFVEWNKGRKAAAVKAEQTAYDRAQDARELAIEAQELAQKAKTEGGLKVSDIRAINDKVTAITKEATGITSAAKDLEALQASSSPTDQLAAIFKFMKALDPASVVRENEQDMARKTGGVTDQFIAWTESLQGGGSLPPSALNNMVNTAITLSDSAIDSARGATSGYLGVFDDYLTPKQYEDMMKRIPENLARSAGKLTPNAEAIAKLKANPELKQAFIDKFGEDNYLRAMQ